MKMGTVSVAYLHYLQSGFKIEVFNDFNYVKEQRRGKMINRFQGKGKFLVNVEYRFFLWRKLGGNVFWMGGSYGHPGQE